MEEHQFKRETNFTLKIFYDKIDVDHITEQQREAYSAAVWVLFATENQPREHCSPEL